MGKLESVIVKRIRVPLSIGSARFVPEYVFALNPDNPRLGLFVPFYMYFLEQWGDTRHPRYDFDTRELVYSDDGGREIRRARFSGDRSRTPALLHPQPAPSTAATGASHDRRELETTV